MSRTLHILTAIGTTICIIFLVVFSLIETNKRGLFVLDKKFIEISGTELLQRGEIISEIYLDELKNSFSAPVKQWVERLKQNPYIFDTRIKIRFPNTFFIHITERLPIARLGSHDGYWIDSLGIILPQRPQDSQNIHLPILPRNQKFSSRSIGKKINNNQILTNARALGYLKSDLPELFSKIIQMQTLQNKNGKINLHNSVEAIYLLDNFQQLRILNAFYTTIGVREPISKINIDLRFNNQIITKDL